MTNATKPIQTLTSPCLRFSRANWEKYKEEIINKISNTISLDNVTIEKVYEAIESLYKAIQQSCTHSIPSHTSSTFLRLQYTNHNDTLDAIKLHTGRT